MEQIIIYDCEKDTIGRHKNCIYVYVNKVNNKKYVGQTVKFKDRHRRHIRDNKYPIDRAITKYGIESFYIYILKENIETIDEMNELEEKYIKEFNTIINEGHGYNIMYGGGNHRMNDLTKKKLSELRKGRFTGEDCPFYGKTHTEEAKQRIREARIANSHIYKTEEFKTKISEATKGEKNGMYGKTHSEETKRKISEANKGRTSKKVCQYDKEGKFLALWDSIKEASISLGVASPNINDCLKNEHYTIANSYWRYYEDENSLKDIKPPRNSPYVAQYTKEGELVKIWDSLKEITETLGYSASAISNNALGRTKSSHKYIWKYIFE